MFATPGAIRSISRGPSAATPFPCSQATCNDLIAACDHEAKPISVRKGKDVIVAGYPYSCLYVTHRGWLLRYKILHDGSRQIIDFILPGDIFGLQLCLFKASIYSIATVTEATLYSVPISMIDKLFERSPKLSKSLFWSAIRAEAILGEHLTDAARRSAYERVSHLLLELFVRLRKAGLTQKMSFEMPLTQEHISDALGLTTVHVNRTLRSLREDKLIQFSRGRVTILDFEALSLLSDFENSYLAENMQSLRYDGSPPNPKA